MNCRSAVCITALFMMLFWPVSTDAFPTQDPPNIIFIMADDLGYGDLGCYGQKVIKTPEIDKLAADGMRFTQCYTGSPVCAPSRSVLMTGKHAGHTTVRGNFGLDGGVRGLGGGEGRVPLKAEDVTIAEVLADAGYVTGIFGKWGLGEPNTTGIPNEQGFLAWFGYLNQRRAHDYYPEYLWQNREFFPIPENRDCRSGIYSHDLFTAKALDFIRKYRRERFFLYLPYTIPHDRYEIPDTAPYSELPWTDDEKVHAAMISRLDADIGKMRDLLQTLGIHKRTIIFFCSDNGAARRWEGRFDSSGDLRGRKRDLYEGGIRTPMIVTHPGAIQPGAVSNTLWYFADVLPTLASIAGASSPEDLDGIDVSPAFSGTPVDRGDSVLYWEFYRRNFQQAIRQGAWKAIRLENEGKWQLFNIEDDPGETRNLAEAYPERVATLAARARAEHRPSAAWPAAIDAAR